MSVITVRLNEAERDLLENYARFNGQSMASILKESFIERLEDEIDLKKVEAYEKRKMMGKVETESLDDVVRDLGFDI